MHEIDLNQHGDYQATVSDLPEYDVKSFFGLRQRRIKPRVCKRVNVVFMEGRSYSSLERNLLPLSDDDAEESYLEFCDSIQPLVQVGGFPCPIESDTMEQDCVNAFNRGQSRDWLLLLQLFEVGDMMWGDAGALYWFIHKDDLQTSRFDRVWMVSQCH